MASSSTKTSWMYDVFVNFRGEDTRHTFIDHLVMALTRAGARTFRDSDELRKGELISEALMRAIEGSRFSLVVFSKNYADSRWCLDELVHIMRCQRERGQTVYPIFYHVYPSDVRKQMSSFGEAFQKHEALKRRTQDDISGWRSALAEAANLSGWDIRTFGNEADLLREFAHYMSTKLNNTYLRVAQYPVGIESRIKDICNSLCDGKEDVVRMVGIVGMGGSGKSALARAVYNEFYLTFENKSFLGNVRETAKESNGKITLQERLLSDILKPTKIEVGDADRGIIVITERLGSKKVLVIVDDVDDMDQLTALALRHDSFGPGSRIIVTTRQRDLLVKLEVDKIHETQEMKEQEARELFSWHAFHNPCPDSEFLKLTGRVVTYCGGLPLALEVLGSFLFKGNRRHWETTLKKLEKFPHDKIQKILKISYDALDENQKDVFLHISCFFVGMDKKYVTHILHGCGLVPEGEISVLLQRCLVTVSERNKLMVHDLLRDMGREIVRLESPKFPEERSRLWSQEDVIDVLTEESGTEMIEGLALNLQRSDKKRFSTKAFKKMRRLKLLQLNYVQLHGDYDRLSKRLRWLCWRGFSLSTIGNEFLNEQNLVSIDLRYSKLAQVWEQSRLLEKLKILNLSHSHYLTHTPDFSYLPKLKYLIMKDCRILSEIHESIGNLGSLVLVNLKDCIILEDVPKRFYNLKSVKTLILTGCSRFQDLSDDIGYMASLVTLLVSGTAISRVPSCLERLRLDNKSRQDLTLVKQRFPDVPRNYFPVFTSLDMGSSSVPSLPQRPSSNNCINEPASGVIPTTSEDLETDHSTALAIIPNSSTGSRQSILQGWTSNGEGNDFFTDGISLSDVLSKLKRMCFCHRTSLPLYRDLATILTELEADHNTNALEIVTKFSETLRQSNLPGWTANGEGDGFFIDCISLSDILSKLERMCFNYRTSLLLNSSTELEADYYSNALELVAKFSKALRQSTLQGMPAKEDGICLAANDFPKRITYVSESDLVFFPVPQSNLQAFTVCAVCSCFDEDMSASRISIRVTNHTKLLPRYDIQPTQLTKLTSHEVICQGQIPINQLNLEGDDFVEVEVVTGSGLRVKKTGVCLVWDPDLIIENMMECEPIPCENFPKTSSSTTCRNNSSNFTSIRKSASENVMINIPTPAKRPEEGVEVVQADANPPSPGWTYVSRRNQATSKNNEECLEAGQTEGKKKLKVFGRCFFPRCC